MKFYPRIDIERLLEDKSDEAYEQYARLIINKYKKQDYDER